MYPPAEEDGCCGVWGRFSATGRGAGLLDAPEAKAALLVGGATVDHSVHWLLIFSRDLVPIHTASDLRYTVHMFIYSLFQNVEIRILHRKKVMYKITKIGERCALYAVVYNCVAGRSPVFKRGRRGKGGL